MNSAGPRDPLAWSRGLGTSGGMSGGTSSGERAVDTWFGFTDRGHDAVDPSAPFGAGNLARHVGDDEEAVEEVRARLATRVGVPRDHLLFVEQVHGTTVAVADGPWTGAPPQADAVVTATVGVALAVMVADCVPVLLADPGAGVVGVAHAGRAGLAAGVLRSALEAMRDLGAGTVEAVVGPCVCLRCYEVPAAMRADVAARVPTSAARSRTGTPSLDLVSGVLEQLAGEGVQAELVGGCTAEDPRLYSYRRDGRTGRFAGVAWMLPGGAPRTQR